MLNFFLTPSILIALEKWFCFYDACIVKIKFKNTTNVIIIIITILREDNSAPCITNLSANVFVVFFFSLHFTEWKDIERWRIVT